MGDRPLVKYRFGAWLVEPSLNQVKQGDQSNRLAPLTMNVLGELLSNAGEVIATEQLLDRFWSGRHAEPSLVARCIKEIRHALGDDARKPTYVETVRKRGYRAIAPVTTDRIGPRADRQTVVKRSRPFAARIPFPFGTDGGMTAEKGEGNFSADLTRGFALSPNGRKLVFVDRDAMLRVRHVDRMACESLTGTLGAHDPFFSADSEHVGFFADGRLKRVSLDGSGTVIVAPVETHAPCGATWLEDDTIVIGTWRSGLKTVPATGGTVRALTALDPALEESHRRPHRIAGHPAVLFNTFFVPSRPQDQVWVLDLRSGERRYLFDGYAPRFVSSGFIVYLNADEEDRGSLWAVPFDPEQLRTTGAPRLIEGAVQISDRAQFSTADHDVLLYLPYPGQLFGSLELHGTAGRRQIVDQGVFFTPRLSHDGSSVAAAMNHGSERMIGIYRLCERASVLRRRRDHPVSEPDPPTATSANGHGTSATSPTVFAAGLWPSPIWSSDDRSITFQRDGEGLLCKPIDQPEAPERLILEHKHGVFPVAWMSDGKTLLYNAVHPEKGMRAFALNSADGSVSVIGPEGLHPTSVAVTRDGTWMAFVLGDDIYVSRFPDPSIRWRVATGRFPRWSSKDKLYFTRHETLWCVNAVLEPDVAFSTPRPVADLGIAPSLINAPYDVDSQDRIVIARLEYTRQQAPVLAINWEGSLQ